MQSKPHENSPLLVPKTGPLPFHGPAVPPDGRSAKRRLVVISAAIFIGVAGSALLYRGKMKERTAAAARQVRTTEVRLGNLRNTLRLTGFTESSEFAQLRAPYLRGGRSRGGGATDFGLVLTQLAEAGAKVKQGDVVAAFDNVRMRDRLDDLRASRLDFANRLNKQLANRVVTREVHDQEIRTAKAALEFARLDLRTAGVVAAIQAEKYRLSSEEAQQVLRELNAQTQHLDTVDNTQIRAAELDLEAARSEERRAEVNLDRMVVRAPIDGMTVMQQIYRNGEPAEVRNGDQLGPGQPYLQIVRPDSLRVQARASQSDITRLRVGAPVAIGFDAYPGVAAEGRLETIGSIAQGSSSRRLFFAEIPVTISLDTSDPRVIPGLSASADVILASATETPIVPREAVFPDDDSDQVYSFVRRGSHWERCSVELGLMNNVAAAVQSGLDDGDVVALERPDDWVACTGSPTTQRQSPSENSSARVPGS